MKEENNIFFKDEDNWKKYGFFNNSAPLVFAYKKTERILSAIHLITESWPKDEPIRVGLRSLSLKLFNIIISLNNEQEMGKIHPLVQEYLSIVLEMFGVLNASHLGGFIPFGNLEVLKKEIDSAGNAVRASRIGKDSIVVSTNLSNDFFDFGDENSATIFSRWATYKDKSTASLGKDNLLENKDKEKSPIKDSPRYKGHDVSIKDKKTDRQEQILSIINSKGSIMIKDISNEIKDCSEKTIQRELIDLVNKGLLKKIGERRWSRYSMV